VTLEQIATALMDAEQSGEPHLSAARPEMRKTWLICCIFSVTTT